MPPAAIAAGGALAADPDAGTAAGPRASASAALVGGREPSVSVSGRGSDAASGGVRTGSVTVADGTVRASAERSGRRTGASARAAARSVEIFDGLVRATRVVRDASADGGGASSTSGSVSGLTIDGRAMPAHRAAPTASRACACRSTAATTGLRASLTRAYKRWSAGTTVSVAVVGARARDGSAPPPPPPPAARPDRPTTTTDDERRTPARMTTPTPTRRATARGDDDAKPAPPPPPPPAERKPAPEVEPTLTGQRFAFPVYNQDASFSNDWHAARMGGAIHEGTDVFGPFGSPAVAVANGTLRKVGTARVPGNRFWLISDTGDAFFYGHLSAFAPETRSGARVKAGQVLGFVGNTGDAEPTPPHVHFEVHPGGMDEPPVNPYPFLTAWRSSRDVPPGTWLTQHGNDTAERPGTLVEVEDFIADG